MTQSEQAHYLVEADISYSLSGGRTPTKDDGDLVRDLLNSAIDSMYQCDGLSDVGLVLNKTAQHFAVSVLVTPADHNELPEAAMAWAVAELRNALNAARIKTPGWPKSLDGLSVRVRSAKVTEEPQLAAAVA